MNQTTIREVEGQEMLDILHRLGTYAFNSSPPLTDKESWLENARARQGTHYVALFVAGEAGAAETGAAIAASANMTQQVRGHIFPMTGIWGVATLPEARRCGYSHQVLTHLLAAQRERGYVFSTLYPFRESFYQRLGYVTFPLPQKVFFNPAGLAPLLKWSLPGKVTLTTTDADLEQYAAFMRQFQPHVHGLARFDHLNAVAVQRRPSWQAVAWVDGQPVGLMLYSLQGEAPTEFLMRIPRFYYLTPAGRYLLLEWIARHIDQANQVEMWLAPAERPESWLVDLAPRSETMVRAPMGRVLDVARIGGLAARPGQFSARISDPICPWNEGVWQFSAVEGRLVVQSAPAGATADTDLTIQGLSALIYGTHDPADFALRGWGSPAPALQTTLRQMLPAGLPYLHEYF